MPTSFNILRGNTVTIANKPLTEGLMTIDTDKKKVSVDWDSNGTLERIGFSSGDVTANSNESGSNDLEGLLVGEKGYKVLPIDSDLVLGENDITLSDIIDNKADIDDYGVDLIAKRVMTNLTAPTKNTDPYVYRKTPTAKTDVVDMHKIVGGSVVTNQHIQNGNFANTNDWNVYHSSLTVADNIGTLTATSDGTFMIRQKTSLINGHKYLFSCDVKLSQSRNTNISFDYSSGSNNRIFSDDIGTTEQRIMIVKNFDNTETTSDNAGIRISISSAVTNDYATIRNLMIIDLTQMFGSAIADYVASNNNGVEWLQSYGFFTEDYYAYQTNKIESVCVSEKKISGFNQWDEEWESGLIQLANGQNTNDSSAWRSKNYIKALPNTNYHFHNGGNANIIVLYYYTSDYSFISYIYRNAINELDFTTPSETAYIRFAFLSATGNYGTTYNNNVCVNISSSKNGTYKPYAEPSTYPISPITLRGLFGVNNGKLTVDGDEYESNGNVTRKKKYIKVKISDASYTVQGENCTRYTFANMYESGEVLYGSNANSNNSRCSIETKYEYSSSDTPHYYFGSTNVLIYVPNGTPTTTEVEFIATLATPTTETTTPFVEIQSDNASATGNPVTVDAERGIMQNAIITFTPIQDLHGYDKPWSGGSGKNLVDYPNVTIPSNGGFVFNTSFNGESGDYTVSFDFNADNSGQLLFRLYSGTTIVGEKTANYSSGSSRVSATATATENFDSWRAYVNQSGSVSKIMVAKGSYSTYEPYSNICPISGRTSLDVTVNGETETLNFGQTVYGGTCDVVNGGTSETYGIVDLGTLNWTYDDSVPRFYTRDIQNYIKPPTSQTEPANIYATIYETVFFNKVYLQDVDSVCASSTAGVISIKDTRYTSAINFKTAMSGVMLCYEKATPTTISTPATTIPLEKGTNTVTVDDNATISFDYRMRNTFISTEEFVDYGVNQGNRDIAIPCGHDSDYYQCFDLPELPTDNNTYLLTCTVTNGEPNITWERS